MFILRPGFLGALSAVIIASVFTIGSFGVVGSISGQYAYESCILTSSIFLLFYSFFSLLKKRPFVKGLSYLIFTFVLIYSYRGVARIILGFGIPVSEQGSYKSMIELLTTSGRLTNEKVMIVNTVGVTYWIGGEPAKNVPLYWHYGVTWFDDIRPAKIPDNVDVVIIFAPTSDAPKYFMQFYGEQLQAEFIPQILPRLEWAVFKRKGI